MSDREQSALCDFVGRVKCWTVALVVGIFVIAMAVQGTTNGYYQDDVAKWQNQKAGYENWQKMWAIIIGEKPLDNSPEGRLAGDLREWMENDRTMHGDVLKRIRSGSKGYPGLDRWVEQQVFNYEDNGIGQTMERNLQRAIVGKFTDWRQPLPPPPDANAAEYHRNVYAEWFGWPGWLIFWMAIGIITACISGFEGSGFWCGWPSPIWHESWWDVRSEAIEAKVAVLISLFPLLLPSRIAYLAVWGLVEMARSKLWLPRLYDEVALRSFLHHHQHHRLIGRLRKRLEELRRLQELVPGEDQSIAEMIERVERHIADLLKCYLTSVEGDLQEAEAEVQAWGGK